jgi:glycosyltransferase involved in cell wall biosynthesis
MTDQLMQDKIVQMKTNILLLIPQLSSGGAERQLVALATGLKRMGYPVKVAVFYAGMPMEAGLLEAKVPIINLNKSRWGFPILYYHLIGMIRRERPDVLYSYLSLPNDWSVLVKPWSPSTRIVWGIRVSNLDLHNYDWQGRMTYILEAKLARFANQIICNSFAGAEAAIKRGIPRKKLSVIPNGIDVKQFRPIRASRDLFRRELKFTKKEKLIGLVGRLDLMKDHANFLQAAALLAQERKDVRFICVGSGEKSYGAQLRKLAGNLGLEKILTWTGDRQDMEHVYNGLDILVLPSSYGEGFANVVGEAMACGVPCVVTDVGDSALIVDRTGEIVPPKDPRALKEGMARMLKRIEHEKEKLTRNCRQRIVNEFSVEKMIHRTLEVLEHPV